MTANTNKYRKTDALLEKVSFFIKYLKYKKLSKIIILLVSIIE